MEQLIDSWGARSGDFVNAYRVSGVRRSSQGIDLPESLRQEDHLRGSGTGARNQHHEEEDRVGHVRPRDFVRSRGQAENLNEIKSVLPTMGVIIGLIWFNDSGRFRSVFTALSMELLIFICRPDKLNAR
jgi:hypothetical protein